MNKTLETAFAEVKTLPEERQEQIGQWMSDFVEQERSTSGLSDEQQIEIKYRLGMAEPVFATDEQVKALFAKFRT